MRKHVHEQSPDPFLRKAVIGAMAFVLLLGVTVSLVEGQHVQGLVFLLSVCALAGAGALIVRRVDRRRRLLIALGIALVIGIELFTTVVYPLGNRVPFKIFAEIALLSGFLWTLHRVGEWISRRTDG